MQICKGEPCSLTVKELIDQYHECNPEGHFFDEETLRFFGERISEMEVDDSTWIVDPYDTCDDHECYMLTTIQHKAPKGVNKFKVRYFDVNDLSLVG